MRNFRKLSFIYTLSHYIHFKVLYYNFITDMTVLLILTLHNVKKFTINCRKVFSIRKPYFFICLLPFKRHSVVLFHPPHRLNYFWDFWHVWQGRLIIRVDVNKLFEACVRAVLPLITGLISSEAGAEKKDCYYRMFYFDRDWIQDPNPKKMNLRLCATHSKRNA